MLQSFLNRPIAEDFSFKNQIWQSLQAGLYVFLFVYLFGGSSFAGNSRVMLLAMFGCSVSTLFANWVVPQLLPKIYNEDRWSDLSAISGGQVNAIAVIGMLILMAWGLGALVDTTKSVLVIACAHEFMTIAVHPVAIAVTLLVWIWLVRTWGKQLVLRAGQMVVSE